jgi:hypothetical protein
MDPFFICQYWKGKKAAGTWAKPDIVINADRVDYYLLFKRVYRLGAFFFQHNAPVSFSYVFLDQISTG